MTLEGGQGITRIWLTEFLDDALPGVLARCAEGEKNLVSDFVRLVEMQRHLFPEKAEPKTVAWVENQEEESELIYGS